MSVLIKGMEMPKSCYDCDCEFIEENYYGDIMSRKCCFIYKGYTDNYSSERREDCPLVELKPPMRLIDAAALKQNTYEIYDPMGIIEAVPMDVIDNAPTIIPEEEGE